MKSVKRILESRDAHEIYARAVVLSTSKILSVICLVETHRRAREYLCRPKQITVVMILQSQLHKVNGRNASSDLTMRPLSSTVEDLGMNTALLAAKCVGTEPPSTTDLYALNKKREPNPAAHLYIPYGVPSGPGADSFCVAIISSNSCLSIVHRISSGLSAQLENGLIGRASFVLGA